MRRKVAALRDAWSKTRSSADWEAYATMHDRASVHFTRNRARARRALVERFRAQDRKEA